MMAWLHWLLNEATGESVLRGNREQGSRFVQVWVGAGCVRAQVISVHSLQMGWAVLPAVRACRSCREVCRILHAEPEGAEPLEPSQGSDSEAQQHRQAEQLLHGDLLGGLGLIKLIGERNQRSRIEKRTKMQVKIQRPLAWCVILWQITGLCMRVKWKTSIFMLWRDAELKMRQFTKHGSAF